MQKTTSAERLVHVNNTSNDKTHQADNIQLSEIPSPNSDSVTTPEKNNQETSAPGRKCHRGLILHKAVLVIICVVIITTVWVLFFTLVVVTFAVNRNISPPLDSLDSMNQNTTLIPQIPVARVTVLNIFSESISDLFLELNQLVLSNNGMNLTGNVTIPVNSTRLYVFRQYNISYYEQVVSGAPKVDFNLSFVQFSFSTSSINSSAANVTLSSSTLLASFSSNQFETSNITVQCPDGFFLSDSFCRLPDNFCNGYHPAGNAGRIISRLGLVLISLFGFLVSIISLLTFFVNICTTSESGSHKSSFCTRLFKSLVTPSLLILFLFAFACVMLFMISDLPNPDDTFCKEHESTADLVVFNMYGAILQFMLIGFLFWVNFTLLNLLLIVSFPFKFNSSKMKKYLFLTELIFSIVIPLLIVIITLALRKGRAYIGLEFIGLIGPTGEVSLLLLYTPFVLACVSILTLSPLILCKMRWNTLRTTSKMHPKATPLEYRIAIYSLVLAVLMIILMTGYIFFLRVSQSDDYFSLRDIGLCTTYRSPASLYRNGSKIQFDSAAEALMTVTNSTTTPVDFMEACDRVDTTKRAYPPGLYILDTFLLRIVISCVFIITLPTYANYQTWRNIFFYGKKHIQMNSTKVTKN